MKLIYNLENIKIILTYYEKMLSNNVKVVLSCSEIYCHNTDPISHFVLKTNNP